MLRLTSPSLALLPSYNEFIEEMLVLGEKVWDPNNPKNYSSPQAFIERMLSIETLVPSGLVTESIFWAIENNKVVGRIALRHTLTEKLREFGGHIGYEVRPSARRRGIAKEMLRLLLQTPKAQSIGRLLLTCSPDNIASNRTITANGGVLEKTTYVEQWQRETNYYWITL